MEAEKGNFTHFRISHPARLASTVLKSRVTGYVDSSDASALARNEKKKGLALL